MTVRKLLSDLSSAILVGAGFVSCFVAPVLATIAEVVLVVLKLLGYIYWSWVAVILAPAVIEVIPLVVLAMGLVLMVLARSPSQDTSSNS